MSTIRFATPDDLPEIASLIHELAEYEKLAHEVRLIGEIDGKPEGFALFFHNFSTFEGKPGIYLEDLFVTPGARGSGLGTALLAELARLAVARDCARLEWSVLDWNAPSIGFYKALGAKPMDEWTVFRLDGAALSGLAARA